MTILDQDLPSAAGDRIPADDSLLAKWSSLILCVAGLLAAVGFVNALVTAL
jgi:hypothetical protein